MITFHNFSGALLLWCVWTLLDVRLRAGYITELRLLQSLTTLHRQTALAA